MQVAQNGAPNVLGAIRSCIGKETDLILDQANEDLANLRQEHSAATRRLNSEIEEWARKLFQAKVSEHDRVSPLNFKWGDPITTQTWSKKRMWVN